MAAPRSDLNRSDDRLSPRPIVVCTFAKAFVPGEVKTRLIPLFGPGGAADLARAMFEDLRTSVGTLPWARPIVATAGAWASGPDRLDDTWAQGEGSLGARLERVLAKALEIADAAIAIGADSPGLPRHHFEQARRLLAAHDAVLGPADDGGFYLVGVRRCPPGLFDGIGWSRSTTFAETEARLAALGMRTGRLAPWFDVDGPDDVRRVQGLFASGRLWAPRTHTTLDRLMSAASARGAGRARAAGRGPQALIGAASAAATDDSAVSAS